MKRENPTKKIKNNGSKSQKGEKEGQQGER